MPSGNKRAPPHLFVVSQFEPIDYHHPDSLRNRGLATRLELDALKKLRAIQPYAAVADPVRLKPTPEGEARAKQLDARGHEPGKAYPIDDYINQIERYLCIPFRRKP
ncbi:hypothetical protein AUJ14_06220 [Candidatus Micrarchaeota archaeon CG1_02_55_22]|nr:MAG: hypothetical protein AUJ14_06220 [Candidatus Micrarchaeota archaeon CG1_02_55_22]